MALRVGRICLRRALFFEIQPKYTDTIQSVTIAAETLCVSRNGVDAASTPAR